MHTCSNRKGMKINEHAFSLLTLVCAFFFLTSVAAAQFYLPPPPPAQPANYGKVILNSQAAKPGSPGAVVFDHWLHRSKFTCRLCHVDIGFAMEANASGIRAESNRQGFHCGACHDGKRIIDGNPVFASCSDAATNQCDRCHSEGKMGVRKYEYNSFTARFPKAFYGINWEGAEAKGLIKPVDFLEGISIKKAQMQSREDFAIKAGASWVHPVFFSHEKHSLWNGCELCHPDIFPTEKKSSVQYSMFSNIEGHHCGACHLKVAFPLNNCQMCHPRAPRWAKQ
jgi:c(7)-type cytochrome triheme protein